MARQGGDAVIGFLADHLGGVAQRVIGQGGELGGLALDLLQEQHVGLVAFEPAGDVALPLADRVDVPSGDLHGVRVLLPGRAVVVIVRPEKGGNGMPIELYTWNTPNGRKISVALEEMGLPYNVHPVNISKNEQFEPSFLKISPNNRIPAIIDPDGPGGEPISVFESGAILIYLGQKTGLF